MSGSARFFEGRLLARVLLVAKAESLNKSGDFARWRSYMEAARSRLTANPSLTLHFVDSRGFVLAKYDAPFREFASIVNEAGESVQYSDQIEVPITPDGYAEVADWICFGVDGLHGIRQASSGELSQYPSPNTWGLD
ncbi:MAG: hypothetical protein WDO56_35120 [Gammaproteobacteria bacterium]